MINVKEISDVEGMSCKNCIYSQSVKGLKGFVFCPFMDFFFVGEDSICNRHLPPSEGDPDDS